MTYIDILWIIKDIIGTRHAHVGYLLVIDKISFVHVDDHITLFILSKKRYENKNKMKMKSIQVHFCNF